MAGRTYDIAYTPGIPHDCDAPRAKEVPKGTIIVCNECGQFWKSTESIMYEGRFWHKVRWYHFAARKRAGA